MKRDKSFGLVSVDSWLLNPAPSSCSHCSSPSPQVLLYAQNKAPGDWLPLTVITAPPDHLHHLTLSCAKQPHTSGSTPVSATYSYRLYSYGRASNITHSHFGPCQKKKKKKSSLFSLSSLLLIFLHESKWGSPLQNRQLFQSTEHFSHLATRSLSTPHTQSACRAVYTISHVFPLWFKLCMRVWGGWIWIFQITKDWMHGLGSCI